jgi:hypothetical protein
MSLGTLKLVIIPVEEPLTSHSVYLVVGCREKEARNGLEREPKFSLFEGIRVFYTKVRTISEN